MIEEPMPLILLPGLDGVGLSFLPLVERLPKYIRPVVVDFPQNQPMGYDELFPMVWKLLPEEPFILVGESFSSPLAIRVAAERPAGLRGLILCSAFATNPLWLSPTWLAHLANPAVCSLYRPYKRLKLRWVPDGPAKQRRLAAFNAIEPKVMSRRVRSALRVNVLDELAGLKIPALYLRGRRDKLVHHRCLKEMSAALPSMQVAAFDGGHCIIKSHADLATRAIVDFVDRCHKSQADRIDAPQPAMTKSF